VVQVTRFAGLATQTGSKKRWPLTLPIYETEATRPRHVDTGIQTHDDDDDGPGFADDYVMPEEEEIM